MKRRGIQWPTLAAHARHLGDLGYVAKQLIEQAAQLQMLTAKEDKKYEGDASALHLQVDDFTDTVAVLEVVKEAIEAAIRQQLEIASRYFSWQAIADDLGRTSKQQVWSRVHEPKKGARMLRVVLGQLDKMTLRRGAEPEHWIYKPRLSRAQAKAWPDGAGDLDFWDAQVWHPSEVALGREDADPNDGGL